MRRELGDENSHFASGEELPGTVGVAANVFRLIGPSIDDTDPLRRFREDTDRGRSFIGDAGVGAVVIFLDHRTYTNPLARWVSLRNRNSYPTLRPFFFFDSYRWTVHSLTTDLP